MRKFLFMMLAFILYAGHLSAQSRKITGKVTDDKGLGIPNTSVVIKGSNIGTTTTPEGDFTLTIPANSNTLLISSIGMDDKEVRITSSTVYAINLSLASKNLENVVVVGYGTQRKTEQTGAIATIAAKELENRPFTSFDKMLQGEVAGLQSVAASGQPGATQNVRIRGIGSINASSAPLYVIDGVPVAAGDISRLTTTSNTFANLNPNDIESISVLKDAASTTIYGSQAANGVILITTKKGKSGKAKLRFDMEVGQTDLAYFNEDYKPLNATEWAMISKEGLINAGNRVGQADTLINSSTYGAFNRGFNTDWLSLLTRKGNQQQYNLSASGGSDKGTYYISGGYYKEDGITIQSSFKRYTAAIRGRSYVSKKLTVTTDVSVGISRTEAPSNGSGFANPVYDAIILMPTKPAYNQDGTINITDFDFPSGSPFNPLYLAANDKRNLDALKLVGNVTAEYKILDNLTFTSRFGGDYNNLEESQYANPFHGDGRNDGGRGFSYYTRQFSWVWTNFADYTQQFLGDKLKTSLKVGYESYKLNILNSSLRSDGFPPSLDLTLAANASTPKTATAIINDKARLSAFTNLVINYDDKYIVSGSFRRDGSSVFGYNNRFGNFWSVGGSWNVNNEKWFATVDKISELKLRASYGVNGNESGFGYYQSLATYGYGYNYNSLPGSVPNNVGDENLSWEINKPFNVGIDISAFKNRLGFSAEYYNRKTTDLLLNAQTSRSVGFGSYLTNIGAMENKGVEFTIKATPVESKNFTWNINLNIAHNKNKMTALYQGADIIDGSFITRLGYDYRTFYTRLWAGVDPANGDPLWYTDGAKSQTTNDINKAAQVPVGSAMPKYFGGFSNTFTFKGLTLDIQLNYNFGNYVRDGLSGLYFGDGTSATRNKVKKQLLRWQKAGDITDVPKYVTNGNKSSSSFSTRYLYKGDNIRVRNVQLAYSIPANILERIHISGLTFYIRGSNILTWVKDKNLPWDPEQGINNVSNGEVFIPKVYTAGLNLSF